MARYCINVRVLQGKILSFTVESFTVEAGFVVFTDRVTGKRKRFYQGNCEIEEVPDGC